MAVTAQLAESNLAQRIAFVIAAIPVALALVWYGGVPLALFLAVAGALGTRELFGLAERRGIRPPLVLGMASAATVAPVTYAGIASASARAFLLEALPYLAAFWLMVVLTWALAERSPDQHPLPAIGVTLLAVAYTAALPAFLLAIRHGQYSLRSWAGAWVVFYPLIVTWICDTAAMFAGRAIGGPKLAPTVSPGKTRSGSIAGVIGGLVVAPIFATLVFPAVGVAIPLWQLLLMAALLGVVGQVGDLAESLLKREAGLKDSSRLIPGHGGVLDRLDSLYFVIPTAAALYRLFGVI